MYGDGDALHVFDFAKSKSSEGISEDHPAHPNPEPTLARAELKDKCSTRFRDKFGGKTGPGAVWPTCDASPRPLARGTSAPRLGCLGTWGGTDIVDGGSRQAAMLFRASWYLSRY
eukprot:2582631-Rhodomonas_salina.1